MKNKTLPQILLLIHNGSCICGEQKANTHDITKNSILKFKPEAMENLHPKLRPISKRYIVGWYDSFGKSYLTTWNGETDLYIMKTDHFYGGVWESSPDYPYYEFIETPSFNEALQIANDINCVLVIAFKNVSLERVGV